MQNTKKESRGAAKISKSLAIQSAARTKAIQLLCNNGNDGRHYPSLYCNEMDLSPLPLTDSWARDSKPEWYLQTEHYYDHTHQPNIMLETPKMKQERLISSQTPHKQTDAAIQNRTCYKILS
jgi:hypothetical protein